MCLLSLISSTSAKASSAQYVANEPVSVPDVLSLNKGDNAPFAGLLFSIEKSNAIKAQLVQLDLYKELSDSQQKSIDFLKANQELEEKKVNTLLEQNDKLSEQLKSTQSFNNWERIAIFTLGIIATVGAGFAIKAASK